MSSRKTLSDEQIIGVLRTVYFDVYEVPADERASVIFRPTTRIYEHLKANEPDSSFALEWRAQVARSLGISERKLPRPIEGHDYTIQELVDMIKDTA